MSPLVINKSSASQLSSLLGRPPLSWNNQWWCVAAHSSGSVQKLPNEGRFSVWRSTGSCATNSALRYQQSTKGTTCFLQYTLHNLLCIVLWAHYCGVRNTMDCVVEGEQDCDIRSPPPGQSTHHSKPTTAFLRALTMVTTLAMGTSITYRQCWLLMAIWLIWE